MCVWHGTKIEYLRSDGVPLENPYQWANASWLEYIMVKEKPPSVTPCLSTTIDLAGSFSGYITYKVNYNGAVFKETHEAGLGVFEGDWHNMG